jgi:Fe-S-cluster containining protein
MRTANENSCRRCGVCCEKGGPGLHREDRPLVDSGRIPARCLFTIRRGELVRDNVKGTLTPLDQEIVKIKGDGHGWTCRFYDKENRGCGIYVHRPLECRALNCRDTRRIEKVYATDRLTREDLLRGVRGLWELIDDHERRCSYAALQAWVDEGRCGRGLKQENAILEALRFDAHIRMLTVKRAGMDAGMLDFIFGRPLVDTIKMFGLRLVKRGGAYELIHGRLPLRSLPTEQEH